MVQESADGQEVDWHANMFEGKWCESLATANHKQPWWGDIKAEAIQTTKWLELERTRVRVDQENIVKGRGAGQTARKIFRPTALINQFTMFVPEGKLFGSPFPQAVRPRTK